jgi:hypothetical protein
MCLIVSLGLSLAFGLAGCAGFSAPDGRAPEPEDVVCGQVTYQSERVVIPRAMVAQQIGVTASDVEFGPVYQDAASQDGLPASILPAGTALHAIQGYEPSDYAAIERDGLFLLFSRPGSAPFRLPAPTEPFSVPERLQGGIEAACLKSFQAIYMQSWDGSYAVLDVSQLEIGNRGALVEMAQAYLQSKGCLLLLANKGLLERRGHIGHGDDEDWWRAKDCVLYSLGGAMAEDGTFELSVGAFVGFQAGKGTDYTLGEDEAGEWGILSERGEWIT